jgi:dTDP-glucose 4,6-dehydratase
MNPSARLPEHDLRDIVSHTRPLWAGARDERWFMTGGTGFIGHWMLGSLLTAIDTLGLGLEVTVLSRHPSAFEAEAPDLAHHPAIRLLHGDAGSFPFPGGRYDRILHLAKEPPSPPGDAGGGASGTTRVRDFALACGARSLLFTSSGAVYGPQPRDVELLGEDVRPAPIVDGPHGAYARDKRQAEAICLGATSSGLRILIARPFALLGPHMDFSGSYAAGNFIADAVSGDVVRVEGDGTPVRSYLYASDLAVWLWTILFRGSSGTPYNVGSPQPISIADLARLVARLAGGGRAIRIARKPQASAPPQRYVPDVARAAALGLRCTVPLDVAILRTADWLRDARGLRAG